MQQTANPATSHHQTQIRAKLEAVTGVPAEHQKVMLSGINQIVMGDKRWVQGCAHGGGRGLACTIVQQCNGWHQQGR